MEKVWWEHSVGSVWPRLSNMPNLSDNRASNVVQSLSHIQLFVIPGKTCIQLFSSFRSWWWTGKPGMLQSMGSQRVGHDWMTELDWNSLWYHELQHARFPCPSLSPSFLKFMSIESVMPSNHLILCHPFNLLPSNFPSIRVFSSESALRIRWPKYWSFSFNVSPSNEYSGLISFRTDRFDLLGACIFQFERILKNDYLIKWGWSQQITGEN